MPAAVVPDGGLLVGGEDLEIRDHGSIGRSIHSVPSSAAFRFVTYAAWCLSWWISIVVASMCGSSASYG